MSIINDAFAPIANATAELLGLPPGYLDASVVYVPHPTSTLERAAIEALVDERLDAIERALVTVGGDL